MLSIALINAVSVQLFLVWAAGNEQAVSDYRSLPSNRDIVFSEVTKNFVILTVHVNWSCAIVIAYTTSYLNKLDMNLHCV